MTGIRRIISLAAAAAVALSMSSCSLSSLKPDRSKASVTIAKKEKTTPDRLPGVVIWGGSMAYGAFGENSSIMKTLEGHMMSDECSIPVANMGVPYETDYTILGRAGATKILTEAFTIPEDFERVEVEIYSADGNDIFPLKYGTQCDGGMTEVTIAGVEGTLSIDMNSAQFEDPIYYFTRSDEGEEVDVKKGEQVISTSMTSYTDYVPVICMGENLGWKTFGELVKQHQAIINTAADKEKYVVIGLYSVPLTEEQEKTVEGDEERAELIRQNNEKYDAIMTKFFGDHYISAREYLCSNVALERLERMEMEDANFGITTEDRVNMANGVVPEVFMRNPDALNHIGYELIGDALYKKMVELGYLYN